jgi:hypothetical protein
MKVTQPLNPIPLETFSSTHLPLTLFPWATQLVFGSLQKKFISFGFGDTEKICCGENG